MLAFEDARFAWRGWATAIDAQLMASAPTGILLSTA